MHNPKNKHFTAVKRILRYIKGTIAYGLKFSNSPFTVTAYCDADWAGDTIDRRSTTGYCVYLGDNLITWSSKKQHTVAKSSTEAEYKAISQAVAEITWLQMILHDLHVPVSNVPLLHCDNISAMSLAANPVFMPGPNILKLTFIMFEKELKISNSKLCTLLQWTKQSTFLPRHYQ